MFYFSVKMWRAAFLLLAASLSVSLARPHLKPLSNEMVNYINKFNTTWKVSFVVCCFFLLFMYFLILPWTLVSVCFEHFYFSCRLVTTFIMSTTVMSRDSVVQC